MHQLPKEKLYTVSEAAGYLGISVNTLKRWEEKGKIAVGRTPTGIRVYRKKDLENLKQTFNPNFRAQIVALESKKLKKSQPSILQSIPTSLKVSVILVILLLVSANIFLFFKTPYPHQAVLGVETFIAPVVAEGTPLGNLLGRVGSIFQRGALVVTLIGGREELDKEGNLNIKGKAIIAKDIEGLGNIRIKGEAIVGKLITDIIDPYLIENEGSVQSTLQIKSVGDISLESGSLKVEFAGSSLSSVKDITSSGSISTSSLTTTKDLKIGGNITLTGSINGNTLNETKLVFSGSSPSIYPSTTNTGISINGNGTGAINIGNSSTGDIYIAGGQTDTGCTITNSNGNINCAGTITASSDLDVRGGDLTTDKTTFNLINTTATTLNVGGAATTISIAATTGTTTINNAATVTGAATFSSTINSNTLTSTALTFAGASPNISASTTNTPLTINSNGTGTITLASSSTGNIQFFSSSNTITSGGALTLAGSLTTGTVVTVNAATADAFVGTAGTNSGLKLTTAGNTAIGLWDTGSDVNTRNWSISVNSTTFGDFVIKQSNARLGDPVSVATSKLSMTGTNTTLATNLIFTDNTFDIGASGASRPRDIYLGRNLRITTGSDQGVFAGTAPLLTAAGGGLTTGIFPQGSGGSVVINNFANTLNLFTVGNTGIVRFQQIGTTASAANAFIDTTDSNSLLRSTSSLRYKNLIGNLSLPEAQNLILNAQPIVYTSKSKADNPNTIYVGFAAEQIANVDARFITYDEQGLPNWVQYPTLTAPLALIAQNHEGRLVDLESSNKNLLTVVGLPQPAATPTPVSSSSATLNESYIDISSKQQSILSRLDSLEKLVLSLNPAIGETQGGQLLSILSSIESKEATISGTLNVLGKTTTNDLGITGKITNGLLSINGLASQGESLQSYATIDTLSGDLHLQSLGLGGIDILNGKVTIDTSGNLKTVGEVIAKKYKIDISDVASSSVGSGVLTIGATSVTITTFAITDGSKIFITPVSDTDKPLIVKNKVVGKSFDVTILAPYSADIHFDWFIIN